VLPVAMALSCGGIAICYIISVLGKVVMFSCDGPFGGVTLPQLHCNVVRGITPLAAWYWLHFVLDDGGHKD